MFLEFGNMWVTGELSKKCIHGQETHPGKATWNVRSMNQGKLEVLKQEMARVNIDILGNIFTSLGLNIFIGVCCLKNTNLLEIVL